MCCPIRCAGYTDGVMTNRQSPFAERWMYPLSVSCLICLLTAAVLIPTLPDRSEMVMSGMLRMRLSILLVLALRKLIRWPSNHQILSPRSVRKRML